MQGLKPAITEASADMDDSRDVDLGAARQAWTAGDAGLCVRLAEPLLSRPSLAEAARALLVPAYERLSEQSAAAGEHALALQQYRRFHALHVEALMQRLARSEAGNDPALLDALTGLARREALDLRLPAMMRQALDSGRGLCLVRIELDPLQPARLGLAPGLADAVLREIGALLRAHSRAKDLALRYAGETLVLALSEVELAMARNICERIRRAVQGHDWARLNDELKVSLSMGLTALRSGDDVELLLARAEAGLVSARRDGRNCVRTGVLGV